jgi:serine/threonine-protein kinase RsbW
MESMERTFKLEVPSSTENLSMIRDFVCAIAERAGLEPGDVAKLELAVDEGCANVIEHAYGRDNTKEVSIRATFDQDAIHIVVNDTGKGFDPASVEQMELESLAAARKSGGLGMQLMKKLMDEVHYEIIPGEKNELRMVKRLKKG